jgi:thiamine-monophosphate kinase
MERVSDVGEFGLIERLTKMFAHPADVLVGAGDDAAVVKLSSGQIVVASCDMLVEGVHFDLSICSPSQVGWRAMTASLSDLAAMGCKPRFATVSIGVPPNTAVQLLEQVYVGLTNAASEHSVAIVGGDTVESPERMVVDVFLVGEPVEGKYLTRSGAFDGDVVIVTGYPGQSAAGLDILLSGRSPKSAEEKELVRAHLEPQARVEQGLWLALTENVTAAIDLSDGLAQDLGHICEMSGVGAVIDVEKLPVSDHLLRHCERAGKNARRMCLSGGEDYELVFTVRKGYAQDLLIEWHDKFDISATEIGSITSHRAGVQLENAGEIALSDITGYNHFRKGVSPVK